MIIKKLTLKNFQLFKDQTINFGQLNILQGINHDSENDSGNGSGKSTVLSAIQFLLYGEVSGINLKDLISFGKEESFVEGIIEDKGDTIRICRTIPTDLKIFVNETEVQGNTNAIKQQWLNNRFGDSNYFRTYRTIDSSKGINLLDQGTTTLRKTLMAFVDTEFSKIRTSLLAKKLERETYNVSKRPYSHYLSTKRKCLLESGLKETMDNIAEVRKGMTDIQHIISKNNAAIMTLDYQIKNSQEKIIPAKDKKCPTCGTVLGKEEAKVIVGKSEREILEWKLKKDELTMHVSDDTDFLKNLEKDFEVSYQRQMRLGNKERRMNEAFKFANYKYTAADVAAYAEAVKVLDGFSGYYINQWLDSLSFIINDLLRPLNMEVIFSPDKEFIKVKDNGQDLKYEQCSSGQKTFLGAIFKLGILLHRGDTSGIVLVDEGFGSLDEINLRKFVDILKSLSFQAFLIYQNSPEDFQDVNYLTVERKNGESKING